MDSAAAAGGPETAETWIRVGPARKERIMGFGHRVYKARRRAGGHPEEVHPAGGPGPGQTHWEETPPRSNRSWNRKRTCSPNLDWPTGRLYHALGLEVPLYTPIFVMVRVAGWSADVIEQLATITG